MVLYKAHGNTAVLDANSNFTITHPVWGSHIRSKVTSDAQGWVNIPIIIQSETGRKLKLTKVEVSYATGWKTIFDAIKVYMGQQEILNKSDFGFSNDKETTVDFEVPNSPQIDRGIAISVLITIPAGPDEHGRWATISSVGAHLCAV
ncbi:hypothetical protein N7457_001252 [Penicillium paradoxum]|uniref:uncharacterized protein n=1 Tax=Penicillium paradoxum TaxID=176176 RepID=UPI0025480965|nr:uncharacterized protein N7457_001252 [Penicillium paradoxum]KAJ5794653.1 hypothetical protein N7457_001252 [Penicillium paradoxum]